MPVTFDERIRLKEGLKKINKIFLNNVRFVVYKIMQITQDTGHLMISKVKEIDESKYMCSATNIHGTAYSFPANIYVRSKISFTFRI